MDQQIISVEPVTNSDILQAWMAAKTEGFETPSSIVADYYGITEPEVIATGCGIFATRLCGDWCDLLTDMTKLGGLSVQVRNGQMSHESVMSFEKLTSLDERICLKDGSNKLYLEIKRVQLGFMVQEPEPEEKRHALYFFDLDGEPVLLVRIPEEKYDLSQVLLSRFIHTNQSADQPVFPAGKEISAANEPFVDTGRLRMDWTRLNSSEGIHAVLNEHGLNYRESLKGLGAPLARRTPQGSFRVLMEVGMDHMMPFRVSGIGASGAILNWHGEINQVRARDGYVHAAGKGMSLNINEEEVDQSWLVELPGADTPPRVEFFNAQGRHLLSLSAQRTADRRNERPWREIVDALVSL